MKVFHFLVLGLLSIIVFQCKPPTTPLLGHWRFQKLEQTHYLPNGELLEASTQTPPLNSLRALDITGQELNYQHEYTGKSFPGDRHRTETRAYTRHGDTLLVVPFPGIEAGPVLIYQLTDRQLVLRTPQARAPNAPYSIWDMYFIR